MLIKRFKTDIDCIKLCINQVRNKMVILVYTIIRTNNIHEGTRLCLRRVYIIGQIRRIDRQCPRCGSGLIKGEKNYLLHKMCLNGTLAYIY